MKALWLGVAVLTAPTAAMAQCVSRATLCFCNPLRERVATVVTNSVAGPRATVQVETATLGIDAGETLDLPTAANETVGARWLLLDLERRRIDDAGTVTCPTGYSELPRVSVAIAASAVVDANCNQLLENAGFVSTVCNDNRSACSVAPVALPGLIGLWVWWRRRR